MSTSTGTGSGIRAVLTRTSLFANWPAPILDQLSALAEFKIFAAGASVGRAGEKAPGIWVVAEGCLVHSRTLANGTRMIFELKLPDQMTGFLAVFDNGPLAFDITANIRSKLIFIPGKPVLDAIRANADVAIHVIGFLCSGTRLIYESLLWKTVDPLRVQLAKFLLHHARGPAGSAKKTIPGNITQDMVASSIGISRQALNKEIAALIEDGVIHYRYRKITILDHSKLFDIATKEEPISIVAAPSMFDHPGAVAPEV